MDERLVEGITYKDESNNMGKGAHNKSKVCITTQLLLAAPPEWVDIDSTLEKVPPDTLGLFIANSGDLVLIEKAERVTLGRHMEDAGTFITLDLTPYGGAQSGVSRRHAVIMVYQDTYLLQDLGSTNGTWLNTACLPPHGSHMLKSGDMIQVGQIRMCVVFHGSKPVHFSAEVDCSDRSSAQLPNQTWL
jgi:hypothetical protein